MASFCGNKYSDVTQKIKQLKSYYDKEGIPGLARQLEKHLNGWKDVHIKIAVTGRAGVGKSSFINAIRGINADDVEHNPAKVDIKECTTDVQEYLYPGNKNFRLYDLPGLGTPRFKRSSYLTDVGFEEYDLFIIITETRFTDDGLWLAQQAEERGKPFYFVRSKIENDIRSDRRAHPRTHNEAALLKIMKEDMESNLSSFSRKNIFLIDNYDTQLYDFGHLMSKIIQDSNEMKQEVLAFSLACLSKEMVEQKKKILKLRIPIISYFAVIFTDSLVLKNPVNSMLISKEIKFYGEQFRVDTTSLTVGGNISGLTEDKVESVEAMKHSHDKTMLDNLEQSLYHAMNDIPIVGSITLGINCAKYLQKCLDESAEQAIEIHCLMTESLAKKYTS